MTIDGPGGPYCYTPDQTRLIAAAATESMASHDGVGLCIGGPKHGETLPFNSYLARGVKIPVPSGEMVFVAHDHLPSEWPPVDYDEYIATGGVTFYGGKMCQILEHTDLSKQNVKARASELDALIAIKRSEYADLRGETLDATLAMKAAAARSGSYWDEEVRPLEVERDALTREHGI